MTNVRSASPLRRSPSPSEPVPPKRKPVYDEMNRRQRLWHCVKRDRAYLLMVLVPLLYFILFKYAPMLGLNIAFRDYKVGDDLFAFTHRFVGLQWFRDFFSSPFAERVVRNTVLISVTSLLVTFPAPILLALTFNELHGKHLRGVCQTVSYMPHFLSTAVVVGIMTNMFSINGGVINDFLNQMGFSSIDFMQSNRWFRTMYVGSGLWANVGFSSIIYAAAIAGVDPTLYEAAYVDGSSRFKNILYITLPCILPTVITMLLLRMGQLMSVGYEKILLMYNPLNMENADVISTYVYRNGITQMKYGFATAVDLFNSVINVCLLLTSNFVTKKMTDMSIL